MSSGAGKKKKKELKKPPTKPRLIEHDFQPERFANLTRCFVCDEMIENDLITGFIDNTPGAIKSRIPGQLNQAIDSMVPKGKGMSCTVCGVNVHDSCREKIITTCARVTHRFELKSFPPYSKNCNACGTALHGLWNQGYECLDCAVRVHPGCRTNNNVRFCAAAPDANLDDLDESNEEGDIYEFVGNSDEDEEADGEDRTESVPQNKANWRKSLSKRLGKAMATATGQGQAQTQTQAKRGTHLIKIPASITEMGREMRKLHGQARAVSLSEEQQYEKAELPKLKLMKTDLTAHKKKVKAARAKLSKTADKRAKARAVHYRTFAKKVLTKHLKKQKKAEIEKLADELTEEYSMYQCREDEMLENLKEILPREAHSSIEKEAQTGPWGPNGDLEQVLRNLDKVDKQYRIVTQSLEAVRREIFFPRARHWFLRVGLEGVYVALGTLWLEQVIGSLAVRSTFIAKSKKVYPTVVLALGGFDTPYKFSKMGTSGSAKARRKESDNGVKVIARVENLSVSGNAAPVSFTLDQLSLDLEFFLNIEMEYIESKKRGIDGVWRLKPNTFSLKFKKFGLNFKSGSLSIPDALLRTVVKNLLTSAAKQIVKSLLPPEFGDYMNFMREHTPKHMRRNVVEEGIPDGKPIFDIFQFHGRMNVVSEIDLETLDYSLKSTSSNDSKNMQKKGGMVANAMLGAIAAVGKATGTGLADKQRYNFKEEPIQDRVQRALGLDADQIDIFVRTQQELGLTRDNLFPDDSLQELGYKALYNVQDIQSTVEAANRLGMKALNGELLSTEPPLRNVLTIVEYVLTFFNPFRKQTIYTPRILALWQGALDKLRDRMEKSGSFRRAAGDKLGSGPVRRIIVSDFIDRIIRLSRKRIVTQIELADHYGVLGVESMLKVGRDKIMQAAAKSGGGNAMLFQLRNTTKSPIDPSELAAEEDDEGTDEIEELITESEDSLGVDGSLSTSVTNTSTDPDDDDNLKEILAKEDLFASARSLNEAEKLPVGQRQRLKLQQIEESFERQRGYVQYVREKLTKELSVCVEASAGDNKFNLDLTDFDLVAPIDIKWLLSSNLFANKTRVNSWRWRRVARVEEDRVHIAMIKLLDPGSGPGTETFSDPDTLGGMHLEFSEINSRIETDTPLKNIMGLTLRPNETASGWSEPGNMALSFEGEKDLRFVANVAETKTYGDLLTLHDYANDILEWSLRAISDSKTRALGRFLLQFLIRYARLNTFFGSLFSELNMSSSENELFVRVASGANHSGIVLELEHDFNDFTDDVSQILETYRTDPINLGEVISRMPAKYALRKGKHKSALRRAREAAAAAQDEAQ